MDDYKYNFEGSVNRHRFGRSMYNVVFLPQWLLTELKQYNNRRLRIDGEVNGHRFHGAIHPAAKGCDYLLLARRFLKTAGLSVGDQTYVTFDIADQDAVDVPEELRFALETNKTASQVWSEMTAGKKRNFAYRVASAKRDETRFRRVEEVIAQMIAGVTPDNWH